LSTCSTDGGDAGDMATTGGAGVDMANGGDEWTVERPVDEAMSAYTVADKKSGSVKEGWSSGKGFV
jgi:hypothetical protein